MPTSKLMASQRIAFTITGYDVSAELMTEFTEAQQEEQKVCA
jgi:hypothetical protein